MIDPTWLAVAIIALMFAVITGALPVKKGRRMDQEPTSATVVAFLHAHHVLTWLKSRGVTASAELYEDGSGRLIIPKGEIPKISPALKTEIESVLHSTRWQPEPILETNWHSITLSSCQGWHP